MEPVQTGGGDQPRPAQSLLEITRDAKFYPILRALLGDKIWRDIFKGALPHFMYEDAGDWTVVNDEDLARICGAIAKATGRRTVRATPKRLRGLEGQDTLVLPKLVKQELLLELVALAANLVAEDLNQLPPPLDLQHAEVGAA